MPSDLDAVAPARGFSIVDYVVFALVVMISLTIGLYHAFTGGKQRTPGEYLMGNRNLRTLPVAMSILVSYVSSILVLGVPAEMYTRGTQLILRTLGYCLACIISSLLFVPLFYGLNVTSSFEVFYMGLVMYSPSTALQAATGFPFAISVIVTGLVSTIYTTLGGMKAVVWTDAFQFVVMIAGMFAIVIQGSIMVGGISKVWNISHKGNRLQFFNFDPDPTERLTFWSTVIGGMFHTLIAFGVGQTSVQRYCSLPTLRQAKRSVFLNIPGLLMINVLSGLVGLVVYSYYSEKMCDPLKMQYISNPNQLVPYFVTDVLNFPGLPGVFLAVLFSGALSSISSSLNAAAAVTWEDLLKCYWTSLKENQKAIILKMLVCCYGALAMSISFLADGLGDNVLWASISFTGATSGPSLGMFLLGAFFPRANAKGAVVGFVVATAFNMWVAVGAYIYKPYPSSLPTSTACCNATYTECLALSSPTNGIYDYNMTTYINSSTITSTGNQNELSGVFRLYSLSFLWYSATGAGITIVIGLLISLCTGLQKCEEIEPSLLIPVVDRMCCCLPEKFCLRLRCCITKNERIKTVDVHAISADTPLKNMDDVDLDESASTRFELTKDLSEVNGVAETVHL
ncbi:hypothetical protein LSH36_24g06030 [Paralvinella palmiformis]|uniref:Sodium-coupled monocarboxylate transporter 1 n=1 Tax=Paralvinella palmiformis TaxID=53620 RepID=A0AAD9NGI7_9ANNE|nr:hypothetical protein LSH36_24g06030 [Paralvinella palmiformis]